MTARFEVSSDGTAVELAPWEIYTPPYWVEISAVEDEIERQRQLWGEQNHPDGTTRELKVFADQAKKVAEHNVEGGTLTWWHILIEEFFEAGAEVEPDALYTELIQVAAVAASWAECVRRRAHSNT